MICNGWGTRSRPTCRRDHMSMSVARPSRRCCPPCRSPRSSGSGWPSSSSPSPWDPWWQPGCRSSQPSSGWASPTRSWRSSPGSRRSTPSPRCSPSCWGWPSGSTTPCSSSPATAINCVTASRHRNRLLEPSRRRGRPLSSPGRRSSSLSSGWPSPRSPSSPSWASSPPSASLSPSSSP